MTSSYLGFASFTAVILYLVNVFYPMDILIFIYSSISMGLLFFAWAKMNKGNRIVVTLLLFSGITIFLTHQVPASDILFSFGQNLNLLALFLLIPLFGTLLSEAGYLHNLQMAIRRRETQKKPHPYLFGFLLTASMGWLLNLGSMPLVYKIGSESFTSFENKRFGLTILRGFGFCMLWSPYFVNVGLILVLYDLSWQQIGGFGITLSIIYALLIWLFFPLSAFKNGQMVDNNLEAEDNQNKGGRSLKPLLLYIVILLCLSFLLEALLPVNMLTVVAILAVFYPLVWAAAIKHGRTYTQEAAGYISSSFDRIYNEMGIFITAGFFGEALSRSQAGEWLSNVILASSNGIIPLFIIILIGCVILLAMFGIHPVIIVLGLGSSLSPAAFGVSPAFMGLLMLAAWMLATQVTPFSGSILMASHLMKEKPWKIMQKNAPFIVTAVVVMTIVLSVFHKLHV
ncbi:TRAP transporter large permease subunit [Bacillus piscicola]|uniref:TRAP transporter large permease subunit n=1 Tax=Bacillus piscicola TaxID=1632684 RepID=UPI001F092BB8|nr:TRAP transporter large permease subunit [Bacillus piscicola]